MSIIIFAILLLYFLYDYRKGSILILLLTPFLSMVLIGGKSLSLFLEIEGGITCADERIEIWYWGGW